MLEKFVKMSHYLAENWPKSRAKYSYTTEFSLDGLLNYICPYAHVRTPQI